MDNIYYRKISCGYIISKIISDDKESSKLTKTLFETIIFNEEDKNNDHSNAEYYSIGDLMGMPYYLKNKDHVTVWDAGRGRPPRGEKDLITNLFPNTICSFYYSLYNNSIFPNLEAIDKAIDHYDKLKPLPLDLSPNTLVIHIRLGDRGNLSDPYKRDIINLSKNFDHCIILIGQENSHSYLARNLLISGTIKKCLESYQVVFEFLTDDKFSIFISNCDTHINLMRKCENLLVHNGGFSLIGFLTNQNNVYCSKDFRQCGYDNEYIDEEKKKLCPQSKIYNL